jgi:ketosteroid isomerase-like protein
MEASNDGIEMAKRGYEAFRRKGPDGILEFLDPEIEWRAWSRFARAPNVVRGHDGVRELFSVYQENFEDLKAEPVEFIEAPDGRVLVPFRLTGREKGSGREMQMDLVHVWTRGENGLVTRVEVYESRRDALKAVGLNDTD